MKTILSKKIIQKEMLKNLDYGQDLVQMYQAGFLDGYSLNRECITNHGRNFKRLNEECKKAFEKRFMGKINKEVLKHGKQNNRRS